MAKQRLASIEEVIEEARNGRMFILVDAEDRENEGDLVIPAQMATPEAINFMARYGRGLICLALSDERFRELDLEFMTARNRSRHQTAFTVSIEAREGISTGISAHDRAHTIAVAIDPTKGRDDVVSPGHVFPLVAREGGVLVRAGHTEAACDIARLAGLYQGGVICEIMNDDGSMARLPDLLTFAERHALKIGTITDLIAYRRKHDNLVNCVREQRIESRFGGTFDLKVYVNKLEYAEHIALVKGDVTTPEPVLVRVHAVNVVDDIIGAHIHGGGLVHRAMKMIGKKGRGAVVIIRDTRPTVVSDTLDRMGGAPEKAEGEESLNRRLLEYGVGAQILLDLGIHDMILLSNSPARKIVGIEGYGLQVVGQRAIDEIDDGQE